MNHEATLRKREYPMESTKKQICGHSTNNITSKQTAQMIYCAALSRQNAIYTRSKWQWAFSDLCHHIFIAVVTHTKGLAPNGAAS